MKKCPLCGKAATLEHNGAPLIDGKVCENCNYEKVIPYRYLQAHGDYAKPPKGDKI